MTSSLSNAQPKTVHIILSSQQEIYQQALTLIQNNLLSLNDSSKKNIYSINSISINTINPNDLIVAIGDKSAEKIHSLDLTNPVIYTIVERDYIDSITQSRPINSWAALVINQPLQRLVSIADHLVSDSFKNKIIIPVSKNNTLAFKEIDALLPLINGTLEIVKVPESQLASKIANDRFFNAGVLVAVHDNDIWSGKSAKLLLYQAFNYKIPVIGYSKKFLTAGALVSVFSPIESITHHTATLINQWSTTGTLNERGIIYPKANIDINDNIARALHFPVSKLESLTDEK